MSGAIKILNPRDAALMGFATFNTCDHICIDLPAGMTTVSLPTADGKRITLCVLPQADKAKAECLDIQVENAPVAKVPSQNGKVLLNRLHMVAFTPASVCVAVDTRTMQKPITLLTVLLSNEHYKSPKERKRRTFDGASEKTPAPSNEHSRMHLEGSANSCTRTNSRRINASAYAPT